MSNRTQRTMMSCKNTKFAKLEKLSTKQSPVPPLNFSSPQNTQVKLMLSPCYRQNGRMNQKHFEKKYSNLLSQTDFCKILPPKSVPENKEIGTDCNISERTPMKPQEQQEPKIKVVLKHNKVNGSSLQQEGVDTNRITRESRVTHYENAMTFSATQWNPGDDNYNKEYDVEMCV